MIAKALIVAELLAAKINNRATPVHRCEAANKQNDFCKNIFIFQDLQ